MYIMCFITIICEHNIVTQNCVASFVFCKSNTTLLHTMKACGGMNV